MERQIIVLPFAEQDIKESINYYREQNQKISDEFIESINISFLTIKEKPNTYPIIIKDIRKFVMKIFPFNIYYTVKNNIIYIIAVFHNKRNPTIWKKRLHSVH